jgi:cytoskeletal protein RodZ
MALSQDEQRMLAEIERRLAADDPGLASCLTAFRRPGPAAVLRSPRARIIGSLFTVLLVAMVSLMVYAMIPFRTHMPRHTQPTAGAPASTAISAATTTQPDLTRQSAAAGSTSTTNARATATATQSVPNRTALATASNKTQQSKLKPSNGATPPDAYP